MRRKRRRGMRRRTRRGITVNLLIRYGGMFVSVREPDFAGAWYPYKKAAVLKTIKEFEADARGPRELTGDLVGGIVPHAGWYFSGKLACNVIKVLSERSKADTVVIFGTHMRPGQMPTIFKGGPWWTPLGEVAVDEELVDLLTAGIKFDIETPQHHDNDNTIELQIPFVRHYIPEARVVTIGAPPSDRSFDIVKALVKGAADLGRRMVVIGSTDLTHYGPNYGMMPHGIGEKAVKWVKEVNDRKAIDLMLALDHEGLIEEALDNHNACCMGAAASALLAGKMLGAKKGEVLAYYTSYDVEPGTSFVGYAGIVF